MTRLLLASASPRRRDLLSQAGLEFRIEVSGADELIDPDTAPEEAAAVLAERKARAVADRHSGEDLLVLGADTVVCVDGPAGSELLGKPEGPEDARRMLAALSGSRHRVVTGVSVVRCGDGAVWTDFERTWVTMRELLEQEIEAYVASEEWRDKAGGYAIQENADAFVTALEEGGFDNVVGLPLELSQDLLARARA